MKLEEATKEELIYWIKQHNFKLREELKNFESDILFYKIERNLAEQLQEKMSNINKKSQKKEKEWRKYNKRQDEILQI